MILLFCKDVIEAMDCTRTSYAAESYRRSIPPTQVASRIYEQRKRPHVLAVTIVITVTKRRLNYYFLNAET